MPRAATYKRPCSKHLASSWPLALQLGMRDAARNRGLHTSETLQDVYKLLMMVQMG